jgi:hypothetical protein
VAGLLVWHNQTSGDVDRSGACTGRSTSKRPPGDALSPGSSKLTRTTPLRTSMPLTDAPLSWVASGSPAAALSRGSTPHRSWQAATFNAAAWPRSSPSATRARTV